MIYMIVAVLVLIADQAVKLWTTLNVPYSPGEIITRELLPGIVHMTNVHNYGAAFSILQNARWPLVAVTAVFVVLIIILINTEVIHTRFGRWTAALVVAGAVGNCIDRVLYGYVVDMFEFEFVTFPVFNVSDIFITVCGVLFCLFVIFHNEPEEVKEANAPEFVRRRRAQQAEKDAQRDAARKAARAARAAKEEAYAAIPKRSDHRSFEEELYTPYDPDDPFAEWELGGVVPLSSKKEEPAAPAAEPAPKAEPSPAFEHSDLQDSLAAALERELAEVQRNRTAPEPAPAPRPAAKPAAVPEPVSYPDFDMPAKTAEPAPEEKSSAGLYSLEDILAEFEDL